MKKIFKVSIVVFALAATIFPTAINALGGGGGHAGTCISSGNRCIITHETVVVVNEKGTWQEG